MAQPTNNSPVSGDPNDSIFNCVACERPDSADNVVACDHCDNWWHYSCAGVSDTIADRSWICSRCLPLPVAPGSTSSKMTSASRRQRLQLELQHLAEKQEYEKKQQELELQKRFLEQKCKLLEATIEANDDDDRRSVKSRVIEIESRNRTKSVASWIESHATTTNQNASGVKITINEEEEERKRRPTIASKINQAPKSLVVHGREKLSMSDFQILHQQLDKCQQSSVPTSEQLQLLREAIERCQLQTEMNPKGDIDIPIPIRQQKSPRLTPMLPRIMPPVVE
ncbi:uncharacterized protein LOC131437241 [Malaya genurostris]|uniref:uncharacterized protein LOC131437241 n=1 Tax=Malaya genurostris TaxID=325434 RepID=UPI0026F3D3FB|nr:uncharacterized protein LOC131437241 [Malaya genurostris]